MTVEEMRVLKLRLLMTAEQLDAGLKGNSIEDAVALQKAASDEALEVEAPVKPTRKVA